MRRPSVWLATSLVFGAIDAAAGEVGSAPVKTDDRALQEDVSKARRLTPESSLGDLLDHPAFARYSRLLMPWDDRSYDETMPLKEFGSLLPYHSHVDPGSVVTGLNRMIEDMVSGKPDRVPGGGVAG